MISGSDRLHFIPGLTLLIVLASCGTREPEYSNFSGFAQGTTYSVVFEDSDRIDPGSLRTEVEKILAEFDLSLSMYVDSSILSRINRNENVIPDKYFTEAFNMSKEVSRMTGGAFDLTVGPLVRAWGFGPDSSRSFSDAAADSLLNLVGMDKVEIREGLLFKTDPRISLDFNAIAQGYSVDIICRYFDSLGLKRYLVEIGGEVRVKGDKGGVLWRIGIDRPEDNNMSPGENLQAIISLKNRALATSGNYRKFYVENGVKYSHTIDPKTGYPARNNLLSVTIVADDCATADGIATACMVMGLDKTLDFLKMHPEFDAFLIYSDEKGKFITWSTRGLEEYISQPY